MKSRLGKSGNPREIELKFHLPTGSRIALEASTALAATESRRHHLVTTYFDTADYQLNRTGLTLRVRRSGNTHTQTVKSRATGREIATNRNEWEWRIGSSKPDVARLATTRALSKAAAAIKGSLQPVFVTDIRRTTRLLHLDDNTVVEVAIDEGTIEAGRAREPVSELELELKSGSILPVYELAAELQALAPMWISAESKAARGWHLRTGQTEGGQLGQMPKLERSIRAALGFREILGGALGHLVANIAATLHGDPEALHQIRSAVRESRAVLQLFEPHLDTAGMESFNARLRRLGEILGEARDWDVFCIETLPAAMADLPAERLEDLNVVAEVARMFAHAVLADTLRGSDFTALVLELAIWSEVLATHPHTLGDNWTCKRLGTLAPSLLGRAAGKAKQRGRHADCFSVTKRHALRKSLKKLCFDVESLAGLYGPRAVKTYRNRCKALQEILGLANDAVVTKRLARSLVSASRPDLAKPVGALSRWSKRRGQKTLLTLKTALKSFRAAPAYWS
ncbi:MAG: CYTH and CHAD domain-containing protein [Terracidiphilus sp.]|jgi:inorganic triphosphatase YgiF